jgi:hypothetical protein
MTLASRRFSMLLGLLLAGCSEQHGVEFLRLEKAAVEQGPAALSGAMTPRRCYGMQNCHLYVQVNLNDTRFPAGTLVPRAFRVQGGELDTTFEGDFQDHVPDTVPYKVRFSNFFDVLPYLNDTLTLRFRGHIDRAGGARDTVILRQRFLMRKFRSRSVTGP